MMWTAHWEVNWSGALDWREKIERLADNYKWGSLLWILNKIRSRRHESRSFCWQQSVVMNFTNVCFRFSWYVGLSLWDLHMKPHSSLYVGYSVHSHTSYTSFLLNSQQGATINLNFLKSNNMIVAFTSSLHWAVQITQRWNWLISVGLTWTESFALAMHQM